MKPLALGIVAAFGLLTAPSAGAKDFEPGALRVCNAERCVPLREARRAAVHRPLLLHRSTAENAPPARARDAVLRAAHPNGYVTGIVATRRLDRFLTYGVHDQRFEPHVWYAVPARLSQELRRLTRLLRPLSLNRGALARSR